jgi:hypothetical protein
LIPLSAVKQTTNILFTSGGHLRDAVRSSPSRRSGKTVAANKTAVASTWSIFPYNSRHSILSHSPRISFKQGVALLPERIFRKILPILMSCVMGTQKNVSTGDESGCVVGSLTNPVQSSAGPKLISDDRMSTSILLRNVLTNPLPGRDTSGLAYEETSSTSARVLW